MRRNKKGFTLVECVVALLLFSIVSVSVLAIFRTSQSQIAIQSDKFRFDLYANNIMTAFQGSDTWETFQSVLKRDLKINIGATDTEETTVPVGTGGTEGGGYGFDTNNVPVAVPFSRVTVQNGVASFENEEGTKLVSFEGDYPNDKLQPNEAYGWDPADVYYAPELCYNGSIKLMGSITTSKDSEGESGGSGTFTWECDGTHVLFSLTMPLVGTKDVMVDACDLDRFLWKKGWYLDNVSRFYSVGFINTTDYYYFIVRDSATNQPVKNAEGQCLYYQIASTTNNLEILNYRATTTDFLTADAEKFYMDLGDTAKITYAFGEEGSVPASRNFTNVVTDDNGNTFKDKWYYYQWIIAKGRGLLGIGSYSLNHPLGQDTYSSYTEYRPKDGVKSEIYYALAATRTLQLYNSDDVLLYPFDGTTTDSLEMLHRESGCNFRDKTRWLTTDKVYDRWYQKGFMPAKEVDEVRFIDNFGTGQPSEISFYSKGEVYARFFYPDSLYEAYQADRDTILALEGTYAPKYNYKKTYSYPLKHLTNAADLAPYKTLDVIKNKIEAGSTGSATLTYYTVDKDRTRNGSGKYTYTYTFEYHTYTVTLTKTSDLTDYNETSHLLTVNHKNGQNTYTETGSATATITTKMVPTVVHTTGKITTTETGTKLITPDPSVIPAALNGATEVDDFRKTSWNTVQYDYSDETWVTNNLINTNADWNYTRTATATVSLDRAATATAPADFPSAWTFTTATNPKLITKGIPVLACDSQHGPYTITIGEETVFVSNATNFEVEGSSPVTSSGLSYEIVGDGDEGDVNAKTYYLKLDYRDKTFVVQVTYSDYTQIQMSEDGQILEPRIAIWALPYGSAPADLRLITGSSYAQYLYLTYRKG